MKKLLFLLVIVGIGYYFLSRKPTFIKPLQVATILSKIPIKQQNLQLNNKSYLLSPQITTVQKKILGIQQQVNALNNNDIASAPSQIQNILNEIKDIPQSSINQIRNRCINICNNL